MAEPTWTSATSEPPPQKKKSIPTWVWVCGSGCLVLLLCGLLATVLAYRAFKKSVDPEQQWPKIAAVLPYDEPHPDLKVFSIPFVAMIPGIEGVWTLMDPKARFQATLMHFSGAEAEKTRREMFDSTKEVGVAFLGNVGRHEVEQGKIEVQGRELVCMRYQTLPKEEPAPGDKPEDENDEKSMMGEIKKGMRSATIQIDLTPEGSQELVVLQLQKVGSLERVSDDEVRTFLAPFHVGPNR